MRKPISWEPCPAWKLIFASRCPGPEFGPGHHQPVIVGGRRVFAVLFDSLDPVHNHKRGHRRGAVVVVDVEEDRHGGAALEQDIDRVAEADILGSLPRVEADFRLSLPRVFAVDLQDGVLQGKPGKTSV